MVVAFFSIVGALQGARKWKEEGKSAICIRKYETGRRKIPKLNGFQLASSS